VHKLRAYIHINAPVQTVRQLADARRQEWLVTHGGMWVRTLSQSWEATENENGTRFTLRLEYRSRLPFFEDLMGDGLQTSITKSVGRLKQLAEDSPPRLVQ
jgi:hypothetical protein